MTFEELLGKYQALLLENGSLKEEITNLNTKLGVSEHRAIPDGRSDNVFVDSLFPTPNALLEVSEHVSVGKTLQSNISGTSDPKDKIELYMSLFKGRDDVYAKRWENKNKGTDGYVPCCLYEWKSGLCRKPKGKCTACSNKDYARLDERTIDDHLRGRCNLVAGIYPLCLDVESLISKLCNGNELGVLKKDDQEEPQKPWETNTVKLLMNDFPQSIKIVKANMLYIPKAGISQRALNQLKRLAAFKNPVFYKAQAMRMPINKNKIPRIISCSDETLDYLCLPRGCEADLKAFFSELKIEPEFINETNHGKSIDIEFKGSLRDEQLRALDELLKHDTGVLSGTTAFGKTVVAIKLIAERKVNTLIIVDKVNLVTQWKNRLTEFLTINEVLPDRIEVAKRGRNKANSTIGQLGAGKNNLNGIYRYSCHAIVEQNG